MDNNLPTADSNTVVRHPPWGTVTLLEEGPSYRINKIVIKPKHHISTQLHYHRSEHWVVLSGTAKVICDGKEQLLLPRQSTYVPMNTRHRVENPGVIPLVMIEIQNGEYLGDDDIVRFPDSAAHHPDGWTPDA
ncbi:MAG: phosphomannose isomerase type II C-terminal cupin domain [Geminocystis sp.]|nr:phosphomannose isomerase type II C-terminal cupin domain [Geminocystis sp.]HIK38195.1 phosphomannose isomerase type II C-terminal cupin domain [Geminocystis sp. M7585_C2015_104]MCS7148667.1 phosphomannose isomerase type II C-terminal cupin domain [Geminocystis sp.]MCX8078197.1 phosphomannose isomerase type II C-terminal cupin domain [Geminocystis sp.]MDW8115081.1 phosphomannose isomerase type II C-terminal cupin domain [Geminocystis sp.]